VNCLEFRRSVGAEPEREGAEVVAHRAGCPSCARYHSELRVLDVRIRHALVVELPATATATARRAPRVGWALAASLVAATLIAGALWTLRPAATLAAELTAHIAHEPEALAATAVLPRERVTAVLSQFGVGLRGGLGDVVYAENCYFRGRDVPHFVVRGGHGPVTVMLLSGHRAAGRERLRVDGQEAVVVPAARGSIAVVASNPADVAEVSRRVEAALVWQR
jgi:hypothetical protein